MSDQPHSGTARLHDLVRFMEGSPVATLMVGLPDQRVRVANEAAAQLIGSPASALVGRRPAEIWDAADGRRGQTALAALTAGVIDSYRAQCQLTTQAGPVAVAVWVRRVEDVGEAIAFAIVEPAPEDPSLISSVAAVLGPDAITLAVGTADHNGRIDRLTPLSGAVLGSDQSEWADVDVASLAHPDDIERLLASVRDPRHRIEGTLVRVRLHHPTRGWAETRCLLFPLPDDETSPLAFVVAKPAGDLNQESDADRLANLELHLLRFAAELHTSAWRDAHPLDVNASRFNELDQLPRRQREIVDRLLRGERIPSIAASMFISGSTVRNHLTHVFAAFGVHSQSQLLDLLRSAPS